MLKHYFTYLGVPIGLSSPVLLFDTNHFTPMRGSGGTDRWDAYPIVFG
ncbi:MAG: hypothetical protein HKN87_19095 [Saprospiraceae bacterium]|nr:hypothetical protein [Saprospiraceae bacterium]